MNQDKSAPPDKIRGIKDEPDKLQLELQWNSLYIHAAIKLQDQDSSETLIKTHLLIDSGATRNFVNTDTIINLGIRVETLEKAIQVTLIDGKVSSEGNIRNFVRVKLLFENGIEQEETFFLTKIDAIHPWILGYEWLKRRNPLIDWSKPSLQFNQGKERCRAISLKYKRDIDDDKELTKALEQIGEDDEALKGEKSGETTPTNSTQTSETSENATSVHIIRTQTSEYSTDHHKTDDEDSEVDTKEIYKQRKFGLHPLMQNSAKDIRIPKIRKRRHRDYIRNLSANNFATLVKQENLDVVLLHVRPSSAQTSENARAITEAPRTQSTTTKPKPKSNSGGYEAQGAEDESELTEEQVLERKVPKEYHDYADVFSEGEAKVLPPHRSYDHKIDTVDNEDPPFGKIYNMSTNELEALKSYIDEMLAKGFIRSSNSPAGAPVLFVKKKNGTLRLCVDYRALNKITIKNRYPLPLAGDLMDRLSSAKVYTKIDLRVGYNNVRIAEGHEWKTAFRTRYGSYEYLVMPFGLTNAPATFQSFMNDIFHSLLDVCVIVYLDDILIYSDNLEDHRIHVRKVLDILRKHNLHARPEKSSFHEDSIEYLGVIISPKGVAMDKGKVDVILAWPAPRNVKELQSFLGFANFYRRFIDNYSGIVKPLTSLLKKEVVFEWSEACENSFQVLKTAFTQAPVLRHYDSEDPIVLECDASDYAIAGIISQYDREGELRPIAFYGRTMIPAELNYDIYDKELLAIVESFRLWRQYLEGAKYTIQVFTDHNNLQYFTTTKQLSRRQARWSERLANFDFIITYRPGRLGAKPDAITRRPDVYPKKEFQNDVNSINKRILIPPEQLRAVVQVNDSKLLKRVHKAIKRLGLDAEGQRYAELLEKGNKEFSKYKDLIIRNGRVYVPNLGSLRMQFLQSRHDHKLVGHPGIRKTKEILMRDVYWKGITRDVEDFVKACQTCRRAKSVRQSPYGYLKTLPIPERKWTHISMDHIDQLPNSNGYNAVLVVVDRLTKEGIFIPAKTTDTQDDLVKQYIQHVFSKHGAPLDIVSDKGSKFAAEFWGQVCKALGIHTSLSTAYHPESDGQTERVNQVLEQYLRCFVNYLQYDWYDLLPLAEFTYNNTPHDSTGVTPFFANKGYHPVLNWEFSKIPNAKVLEVAQDWDSLNKYLREHLKVAMERATYFANQNRRPTPNWNVGDKVYLNTKNIKTKRPTKKFDWKNYGPFTIIEKVKSHAYKLELPDTMDIHNVFHVNLLSKEHPDRYPDRTPPPPAPFIVDGEEEFPVEAILDIRKTRRSAVKHPKYEYLVKYEGIDEAEWTPPERLAQCAQLIYQWHKQVENLKKPKPKNLKELFVKGLQEEEIYDLPSDLDDPYE